MWTPWTDLPEACTPWGPRIVQVNGNLIVGWRDRVHVLCKGRTEWKTSVKHNRTIWCIFGIRDNCYILYEDKNIKRYQISNKSTYKIDSFLPETADWECVTQLSEMHQLHRACIATSGTNVYVLGGLTDDWQRVSTAHVFSFLTEDWLPLPNMPTPRSAGSATIIGQNLYIGGGRTQGQKPCNILETLSLETHKWTSIGTTQTYEGQLAAVGEQLLSIGGHTEPSLSSPVTNQVDLFEPSRSAWFDFPPMAIARRAAGVCSTAEGGLLVAGGWNRSNGDTTSVESICL